MCAPKCPRCEGRDWKYAISPRGTQALRVVHALCLSCGYEETYIRGAEDDDIEHTHRVAAVQDRTRVA